MIYIGEFFHLTNQEEVDERDRRHGEFNLVVEAFETQSAINMFKQRIVEFRQNSEFFMGECKIFFIRLLEFENFPQTKALMLNYKSMAGDPVMPYISCSTPNGETDGCRILNWMQNRPEIDGEDANLFMAFKS